MTWASEGRVRRAQASNTGIERIFLRSRFFEGTPVRANDFSQSWIDGPRMLPSRYARPGQRVQLLPCTQDELDRPAFRRHPGAIIHGNHRSVYGQQ